MGRVYRAVQLATGQTVALKLLHPDVASDAQVVQRFKREAKLMTELSHPHIVKVIEFGDLDGQLFLAMEMITGKSLASMIERGGSARGRRLSVKRTLAIMGPVLDALEYAHARGVVHRDLKPENIMVIPGRGLFARDGVKLLDFGIAKLGDRAQAKTQKLTQHGLVERESRGTAVYFRIADDSVYALCDLVCGNIARRFERAAPGRQAFTRRAVGASQGKRR